MFLPGSKSLTNRDLVLAALSSDTTTLQGVLFSDDTRVMIEALRSLGFELTIDEENLTITLTGGIEKIQARGQTIFLGNSGTSMRFLTALCSLISDGSVTLTGVERMCQRPIGELTQALRVLGANIEDTHGYPPLTIRASNVTKDRVEIDGSISSQFITALMMIGPLLPNGLRIDIQNTLTSIPYVRMTENEMQKFDMQIEELTEKRIKVAPLEKQKEVNKKRELIVEGDASALSYWALYSLLLRKEIIIENLGTSTQQGDYNFLTVLKQFGLTVTATEHTTHLSSDSTIFGEDLCKVVKTLKNEQSKEADFSTKGAYGDVSDGGEKSQQRNNAKFFRAFSHYDFSDMPDVSMTFFILALFLPGNTHITGLHTLNKKECRRIEAMGTEIKKLGVVTEWTEESITIGTFDEEMWKNHDTVDIETYDDHRIAMCFGILGECIGKLNILNASCVSKTYPKFWDDLISLK